MGGGSQSNAFSKSKGRGGRAPSQVFDALEQRLDPSFKQLLQRIDELEDNPFVSQITGGQEDLLKKLGSMSGTLDSLPSQLKRTALASTDAGAVAAVNVAKAAGSGRGGVAFGGGGGVAVATRAANQAATQQGAALASSLVQGEQARAAFELNLGGLESRVTDQLSEGRVAQAGFTEGRQLLEVDARKQFLDILGQMARSGMGGTGGSPSTRRRSKSGSQSSSGSYGGGSGGGGGGGIS